MHSIVNELVAKELVAERLRAAERERRPVGGARGSARARRWGRGGGASRG